MGHTIIKPKRDEDFYVVHSSVVDAPVQWGTRAELEADYEHAAPERFERADSQGSSAKFAEYWWDDDEVEVREGFNPDETPKDSWSAYVARADLRAFCESIRSTGTWNARSCLIKRWSYLHEDGDVS